MLRCKPDDLAMILEGKFQGYFVTVIEFIGDLREGDCRYKDCWVTTPPAGEIGVRGTVAYPDKALFPIRPGDLKEDEETEKEVVSEIQ